LDKTEIRTRTPWSLGTWAWLLNRIAGTALILYLLVHIMVISQTLYGAKGFDSLMELAHQPVALALEIMLMMAVAFHGLNGLRHVLIDFGICGPRNHLALLWTAVAFCVVIFLASVAVFGPIITGKLG
jgi:succinate dehydrogenase / fumarate reductase cytochrome b subunit